MLGIKKFLLLVGKFLAKFLIFITQYPNNNISFIVSNGTINNNWVWTKVCLGIYYKYSPINVTISMNSINTRIYSLRYSTFDYPVDNITLNVFVYKT